MSKVPAEDTRAQDFRAYLSGFILAAALTAAAFSLALTQLLGSTGTYAGIALLALVQVVVHMRYFMHIDLSRQKREDLQLILFALLIIIIITGGTLWVLGDLMVRMG